MNKACEHNMNKHNAPTKHDCSVKRKARTITAELFPTRSFHILSPEERQTNIRINQEKSQWNKIAFQNSIVLITGNITVELTLLSRVYQLNTLVYKEGFFKKKIFFGKRKGQGKKKLCHCLEMERDTALLLTNSEWATKPPTYYSSRKQNAEQTEYQCTKIQETSGLLKSRT